MNRMQTKQDQQTLDEQRELYKKQRMTAMPIAGTIVWLGIAILAPFLSESLKVWSVWIGCGSIFYLGWGISKLTGEDFMKKSDKKNAFNGLFAVGVITSLLVFAIAMPVASIDHTTIPLTVGILSGLMWMPFSWIIQHWVGYFHAVSRSILIAIVWLYFPEHRFEGVAWVIVSIYLVSIPVLELRYRNIMAMAHKHV